MYIYIYIRWQWQWYFFKCRESGFRPSIIILDDCWLWGHEEVNLSLATPPWIHCFLHHWRQVWQFLRLMELRCDYVHDALILGHQKSHHPMGELRTYFLSDSSLLTLLLKFTKWRNPPAVVYLHSLLESHWLEDWFSLLHRSICPTSDSWRWLSTFLWQDGPGSSEQSAKRHLPIWTKVLETYLPGCQEVDWHATEIWARATVPLTLRIWWMVRWVLTEFALGSPEFAWLSVWLRPV